MHQKFIIRYSSFIILLFTSFFAFSSPADSLKTKKDSTQVSYFYNDLERFSRVHLHPNDTTITGFQIYDPLFKQNHFSSTLGNIGLNYNTLVPYSVEKSSGFDYGIHTFDRYLLKNDSIKYYKVLKTYTELQYVQGAKKEIFFEATFSRNLYRTLNLGFDFRVLSSPGAYSRQKTNHVNFDLTLQYFSKDRRYGVIANFRINRLKNYENGGIKYDYKFEQNIESNRQLFEVNLSSAQNIIRESGFFMKHYFNLSRHPKNSKDSIYYSRKHIELGRMSYSFEYNKQSQAYSDGNPKSGFYHEILLDSTKSYDSVGVRTIINEVIWTNPSFTPEKKLRLLQLEGHFKQQYIEVAIHEGKKYFVQYIPSAGLSFDPLPQLHLDAYGDYVLGDYNKDDLSMRANLGLTLGKADRNLGIITFKVLYTLRKPGWFYEHYMSNNFRWDTAWKKQSVMSGCFDYSFKTLHTGISISRINHYVYLDTTANPRQDNTEFGYIYSYLNGDLNLWKFKFKGQLAYQTIQGTTFLRLPAFMGTLSIYFTQILFHGAATLQPGFNFFYNTQYYGNSYMPATRSFYLQDTKEIGNYLYMDFFINVKIQRARLFVSYSNFGSFFFTSTYYSTPHYPMQDAAFRFGVSWKFYD